MLLTWIPPKFGFLRIAQAIAASLSKRNPSTIETRPTSQRTLPQQSSAPSSITRIIVLFHLPDDTRFFLTFEMRTSAASIPSPMPEKE